jgi:hypothetical protein
LDRTRPATSAPACCGKAVAESNIAHLPVGRVCEHESHTDSGIAVGRPRPATQNGDDIVPTTSVGSRAWYSGRGIQREDGETSPFRYELIKAVVFSAEQLREAAEQDNIWIFDVECPCSAP